MIICDFDFRQSRREDGDAGMALVIVIPIFLFLSLTSLLFIQLVNSKLSTAADEVISMRADFLTRSAMQQALLEVQDCSELAANARKNRRYIHVVSGESLPRSGRIFLGGHTPGILFNYEIDTNSNADEETERASEDAISEAVEAETATAASMDSVRLNLDPRLRQNMPTGTKVYLCRDLDGDGRLLSIAPRRYEDGIIEVIPFGETAASSTELPFDAPIVLRAKASIGAAQTVIERAIVFP
jgi:hypothetical protein